MPIQALYYIAKTTLTRQKSYSAAGDTTSDSTGLSTLIRRYFVCLPGV